MEDGNWEGSTHVDAPELLDAVEADDLLQQLIPVLLAAWRLGEPESPCVLQLMLDVEVGRVIEYCNDSIAAGTVGAVGRIGNASLRRDGDRV